MIKKIIIFIDNSNLFHSFQKLKFYCDYKKLKKVIASDRKIVFANLYTGIMYPVKDKDKAWLSKLGHLGYNVITRAIKVAPDGRKSEKRIDVLMSVDIISAVFEEEFDKIVLVSGDGDFVPVVKKVKELGKKIEIWSFRKLLSENLKMEAGKENCYFMDSILNRIKM